MLQSIFRSRGLLPLRTQYTNFFTSNRTFNSSAVCRSRPEPDRRLQMTFTCTANACGHRSSHEFSARAYNTGIVLLRCPHCKNRHLIADHVGWFKESTENGRLKTVEDLLRARGESVQRGRVGTDGVIEYYGPEEKES